MRPLVIDDAARAEVKRVTDFAASPENFFDITKREKIIPGDHPEYVAHLNTFRCVFTVTKNLEGIYRHLSISVPGGKYPNVFAAYTIAELFGFTGWNGVSELPPQDWIFRADKQLRCVLIAQPMAN